MLLVESCWCLRFPAIVFWIFEVIGPSYNKPIIGIRPGEKIHEEMITSSDSFSTIDLGHYYGLPSDGSMKTLSTSRCFYPSCRSWFATTIQAPILTS